MQTTICNAIAQKRIITFWYENNQRTVEPWLLGYNQKQHLALSAWQLSGGSAIGWREFLVSNISGLAITDRTFLNARQDYNPNDVRMVRILCRV